MNIKTKKQWNESEHNDFADFVKPGDLVDDEIVEYFRDVLPPFMYADENFEAIQCSEPLRHNNEGKPVYNTFIRYKKKSGIEGDKTILNVWYFSHSININEIMEAKARRRAKEIKKVYIFTYREEFTAEIEARTEKEAREKVKNVNWDMLGEPHEDFLTIEIIKNK